MTSLQWFLTETCGMILVLLENEYNENVICEFFFVIQA